MTAEDRSGPALVVVVDPIPEPNTDYDLARDAKDERRAAFIERLLAGATEAPEAAERQIDEAAAAKNRRRVTASIMHSILAETRNK